MGIAHKQEDYSDWMVKVLFYEILVGKGKIQGGGAVSRFVKEHATQVKEALEDMMKEKGIEHVDKLVPSRDTDNAMPRHARVNTLKISVMDAITKLQNSGFQLVEYSVITGRASTVAHTCFAKDYTLDDVLVFKHGTDLHDHAMVKSAELRLQDKASCFPAHVLSSCTPPIRTALDACSAPGNKTTHLSALMNGQGKLVAVEMDRNRAQLLRQTVQTMAASNVEIVNADFFSLPRNKKPYCDVEGIMLDPSCSGSGIGECTVALFHITCTCTQYRPEDDIFHSAEE